MDLRLLKAFDVVASFMSFNRAAEVLNCTQSTVSAQIKSLEEDLGVPVFERLGRRIALTPAGEELLQRVRRLLSYENEVRAAVKGAGETVGLIRLRVPQSVAEQHLPRILQSFHSKYPRVGFDVSNCGYYHLPNELRTGEIDAGFLLSMALDSADLLSTSVFTEPLALVAHPASKLAKLPALQLKDLEGQTLLLPKHDCAYRMKFQQDMAKAHINTTTLVEMNSTAAVVACASAGIGIALVPEGLVTQPLESGELVKLAWSEPLSSDLHFIRHRDKPLVGAFGAFVTWVEKYFTERRKQPVKGLGMASDSRVTRRHRATRQKSRVL